MFLRQFEKIDFVALKNSHPAAFLTKMLHDVIFTVQQNQFLKKYPQNAVSGHKMFLAPN